MQRSMQGARSIFAARFRRWAKETVFAGRVRVSINQRTGIPLDIEGQGYDLTDDGFRMRHASDELKPGIMVMYRHHGSVGIAQVIWSRRTPNGYECGFRSSQA